MTIVLDVSFSDHQEQGSKSSAKSEKCRRKEKDSSKKVKEAKLKYKNENRVNKKLSSASLSAPSLPISIKDSLVDNKEKLNDLNDQIVNSQSHRPHHHHNAEQRLNSSYTDISSQVYSQESRSNFNPSQLKSESIMSSDSDIRFTRKKLGDNQRCGCMLIASFLVLLLVAGLILYAGYLFLYQKPAPNRIFRGRIRVIDGDFFTMSLTDQNSVDFVTKARDYRERINLLISRSEFRKYYDGCEVLALDGWIFDERRALENKDLIVHFLLNFDPKSDAEVEDLKKLFISEFHESLATSSNGARFFKHLKMDLNDFQLKEINFGKFDDIFATSSAHIDSFGNLHDNNLESDEVVKIYPARTCEASKLKFCRQVGYNMTSYPNLLGHQNREEIEKDLITFREIVDSECFLQAYDFLCHLLQPPCELSLDIKQNTVQVRPRFVCRSYCHAFADGCLSRIPQRFKPYFDCERFPEQSSMQSCHHQPNSCLADLKANGQGLRICDGIGDCANLEDELACSYCPPNSLHCGRGRSCVSRDMRCDGKFDCLDGSDEKDCLSISPLVEHLVRPKPLVPHRPQFFNEGFAVFSEKGQTGKLCAEEMETNEFVRSTVAESLCKALGYERVMFAEVRNDTEANHSNYVRVLDPRAAEISFVRTGCPKREAFYLGCSHLECGKQSVISSDKGGMTLPKMAMPGDWPFHVALFKKDNHVCDGTLVANHWVLTTASCFQGQTKAVWMAIFGSLRIGMTAPWTQKRRIVGMVKSPVEGSTAALIRLESPVVYSDFVRPICLPDDETSRSSIDSGIVSANLIDNPHAEKFSGKVKKVVAFSEERQFFQTSDTEKDQAVEDDPIFYEASELVGEYINSLKPEAQVQTRSLPHFDDSNWKQCNTLGWSRQKEHLQRVQLSMIEMQHCENISIATVNSLCAESTYKKQDCNEEEFAGSAMLCLLPDEKRWALVGVSSWRIACTHSGTERPRMYDKIGPNVSWIRDIINSILT